MRLPLTRRAMILLILVIAAAGLFLYDLSTRRSLPKVARTLSPAVQAIPLPALLERPAPPALIPDERWKAIQERTAEGWGRDPFLLDPSRLMPDPTKVKAATPKPKPNLSATMKVTGIVWGDRRSRAVINDFVVQEGDEIAGAKVLSIQRDRVVLMKDGQEHVLKLGE